MDCMEILSRCPSAQVDHKDRASTEASASDSQGQRASMDRYAKPNRSAAYPLHLLCPRCSEALRGHTGFTLSCVVVVCRRRRPFTFFSPNHFHYCFNLLIGMWIKTLSENFGIFWHRQTDTQAETNTPPSCLKDMSRCNHKSWIIHKYT